MKKDSYIALKITFGKIVLGILIIISCFLTYSNFKQASEIKKIKTEINVKGSSINELESKISDLESKIDVLEGEISHFESSPKNSSDYK